ncbi:MAG: hypothetical protein ACXWIU_09525 [Limisphaerales bacterium]
MRNEIWLFYDPSEDGGWDVFERNEEFETPLMFGLDNVEFLGERALDLTEVASGQYQVCAKVLETYEDDFLLDCGLRFYASIRRDTQIEGTRLGAEYIRGRGSFFASPLWVPQWPRSLTDRCNYRLRVIEIRNIKHHPGWERRDASDAQTVASMGEYDPGAWFLILCKVVAGPSTS